MSDRRNRLLGHFIIAPRPGVVDFLTHNIRIPKSLAPARVRGISQPVSFEGQGFAPEILECWNPSTGVTDCTVMSATQVFKTFGMLMGICYRIIHVPQPMLIVFPSKHYAQNNVSRKKLQPLINGNDILAARKPLNADHFKDMEMAMLGGAIRLTGANSATELSGTTEGIIAQDEVCKFEHRESEESPEAHPMLLADERAKDYGADAFRYKSSSPNHIAHPFYYEYDAGTQTHFLVACPNCDHHFPFEDFPNSVQKQGLIGYEKVGPDYRSLVWSPDAREANGEWNEQKLRETIRYICPNCGFPIEEHQRTSMLAHVTPHNLRTTTGRTAHRSFRLPAFYAHRLTFADVAWNRMKRVDLFDNSQNHYNSWLALPWQELRSNIKDEDVRKLRDISDYRRGEIPRRPYALALCADVGDRETHYEVVAIMDNDEIAVVDWGTVLTIEDCLPLPSKLKYTIRGTDDQLAPARGFIDSADQTIRVMDMCRKSRGFWFPSEGSDTRTGTWGKQYKREHQLDVYTFSTHNCKNELYEGLIKEQRAPRFYIPRDADESLIKGHAGQQKIRHNGQDMWKKVPADHYGDCSLRALLFRMVWRAERGEGAPDIA